MFGVDFYAGKHSIINARPFVIQVHREGSTSIELIIGRWQIVASLIYNAPRYRNGGDKNENERAKQALRSGGDRIGCPGD